MRVRVKPATRPAVHDRHERGLGQDARDLLAQAALHLPRAPWPARARPASAARSGGARGRGDARRPRRRRRRSSTRRAVEVARPRGRRRWRPRGRRRRSRRRPPRACGRRRAARATERFRLAADITMPDRGQVRRAARRRATSARRCRASIRADYQAARGAARMRCYNPEPWSRPPLLLPARAGHRGAPRARRAPPTSCAWTWRGRVAPRRARLCVLACAGVPLPCGLDVPRRLVLFLYARLGALPARPLPGAPPALAHPHQADRVVPVHRRGARRPARCCSSLLAGAARSRAWWPPTSSTAEVAGATADELQATADAALAEPAGRGGAAPAASTRLLAPARAIHPDVAYALRARRARRRPPHGAAPRTLPAWCKAARLRGPRARRRGRERRCAAVCDGRATSCSSTCPSTRACSPTWSSGRASSSCGAGGPGRSRAGGGRAHRRGRRDASAGRRPPAGRRAWPSLGHPGARRWRDGEAELDPLAFRFHPCELVRRALARAPLNMARPAGQGPGRGGRRLPGHVRGGPRARPAAGPLDHPQHPRALAGHGAPAPGRLRAAHPRAEPRPARRAGRVVQPDGARASRTCCASRRRRSGWRRSCASPARSR